MEMRPVPSSSVKPRRGTYFIAIVVTVVGGASCSPVAEDPIAADSAGAETVATLTTAAQPATTAPVTTDTELSEPTVTTAVTSTIATGPSEAALNYLRALLAGEAAIRELVEEVRAVNMQWDNRAGNDVAYSDVEAALEDAVQHALELVEAFELFVPPSEVAVSDTHEKATVAVRRMPDMISEMLDGLRSSDTGQARQAAVVRFTAAFNIFSKVVESVASILGEVRIAPIDDTTTTTQPENETTTTTAPDDTTTTTQPENETTTTTPAETAAGVTAQWWRPGLAEEALALVDPGSVEADHWDLVEEQKNYGRRSFHRLYFLSTPVPDSGLTQQHQREVKTLGEALASVRPTFEQSPVIYYPYRYDIRFVEYPDVVSVSGVYPRGETLQLTVRQSGAAWSSSQDVDIPDGPAIRPTTPFVTPRWTDTAGVLGRNCPPVEEVWTRGASVTDSCTLQAIETVMDYLWTESSELRQRAVRDGHVMGDLLGRLDNQENAYLAALYGEDGRLGVTTKVRNVRWAGNWPGASMILLEYQNTHADRELTDQERRDAIDYFTGLAEQGVNVESTFLQGDFTLGFAWPWESALMVRTADGAWRMSYRSFCQFHQTLYVVDQLRFLCPGDPTPHFPDSDFYDRDLWPPNHVLYYDDPRQEDSPRLGGRYIGVPPS